MKKNPLNRLINQAYQLKNLSVVFHFDLYLDVTFFFFSFYIFNLYTEVIEYIIKKKKIVRLDKQLYADFLYIKKKKKIQNH